MVPLYLPVLLCILITCQSVNAKTKDKNGSKDGWRDRDRKSKINNIAIINLGTVCTVMLSLYTLQNLESIVPFQIH